MSSSAPSVAETRRRRRALGLRSTEAVLHESEIATLDTIKSRLRLTSRSDAIRVVMAKIDPDTLTAADAEALKTSAR